MWLRILLIILIVSVILSISCATQKDDIPIDEIEEALGFVYVPDYIPDSFAFGGVEVNDLEGSLPSARFMYVKISETSGPIQLFVEYPRYPNQCDMNTYAQAPADAFESRDFNGLPGCIIRGRLKPTVVFADVDRVVMSATQGDPWDYELGYRIQVHAPVTDTRRTYILVSTFNQGNALTEEDLIKVTESLRLVRS